MEYGNICLGPRSRVFALNHKRDRLTLLELFKQHPVLIFILIGESKGLLRPFNLLQN